ncbi:hypothetical protein K1T71_009440 [Dendrolimus kikuchii]|uniref:Uncharacterized protein n=1 Tax=Dendrolimus kikuchii TaxID=765133 RepID=A0ACC1CV29_9NEOP|nr:hypothetical protein K1T71_009440 [Dendrolimus kikuchii]
MKVLALFLLCALASVQGRSAVKSDRALAVLGENPWVVHLRIAISTSGLLESCVGSLIGNSWVLTTSSCLSGSRFIWVRYGAVVVINPSLVTETSAVVVNPDYDASTGANNVALISTNRHVETTDNIAPIGLASEMSYSGQLCVYGAEEDGTAGESLSCYEVAIAEEDGNLVASGDGVVTKFDVGAPVVADGVQVAIVVEEGGTVLAVSDYVEWINDVTGLSL